MSQQNVEVVKQGIDAFNHRNVDVLAMLVTRDFVASNATRGVRCVPRSANARHECFRADASAATHTAPAPEMDETRSCGLALPRLLLHHGEASVSPTGARTSARLPCARRA